MAANWWGISAQIVAWLGIAVVALSIIGPWVRQRIKRRRRCPKCWYDMSHSPGVTCSECGFTAKRERKLFKARRRWRFAFLGMFMLLGAYALYVTPAVKGRGWVAAVPTTILILSLPWIDLPDTLFIPQQPITFDEHITAELRMRLRMGDGLNWRWQGRLFAEICLFDRNRAIRPFSAYESLANAGLRGEVFSDAAIGRMLMLSQIEIKTRDVWPAGATPVGRVLVLSWPGSAPIRTTLVPLNHDAHRIVVEPPRAYPMISYRRFPYREHLTILGFAPDAATLEYKVIQELNVGEHLQGPYVPLRRGKLDVTCREDGKIEDIVSPVDLPEFADALQATLRPEIHFSRLDPRIDIPIDGVGRALLEEIRPVTFAVRITVLADGQPVAEGSAWWRAQGTDASSEVFQLVMPWGTLVQLTSIDDSFDVYENRASEWTVRLRGDPMVALRDLEATAYWSGEVELPLEVHITPPSRSHPDTHPESR